MNKTNGFRATFKLLLLSKVSNGRWAVGSTPLFCVAGVFTDDLRSPLPFDDPICLFSLWLGWAGLEWEYGSQASMTIYLSLARGIWRRNFRARTQGRLLSAAIFRLSTPFHGGPPTYRGRTAGSEAEAVRSNVVWSPGELQYKARSFVSCFWWGR